MQIKSVKFYQAVKFGKVMLTHVNLDPKANQFKPEEVPTLKYAVREGTCVGVEVKGADQCIVVSFANCASIDEVDSKPEIKKATK